MERKRIYKYGSVMLIYVLHSIGIASYQWNVYCKEACFFLHIKIFYDWLSLHLVSQSVIKISQFWYLSLFVPLAFQDRRFVVWFFDKWYMLNIVHSKIGMIESIIFFVLLYFRPIILFYVSFHTKSNLHDNYLIMIISMIQ